MKFMNILTYTLVGCTVSWLSPIWGLLYLNRLGKIVNRTVRDESGTIYNTETNKPIIQPYTKFERILSSSCAMPWYLLTGPYAIILVAPEICRGTFSLYDHIKTKGRQQL